MAWTEQDNTLYQKLTFKDFAECFAFMTRVAFIAEKLNHHPVWHNTYNTVEIWLCTHSDGNIVTEKDHTLATYIDIYAKQFAAG